MADVNSDTELDYESDVDISPENDFLEVCIPSNNNKSSHRIEASDI